MEINSEANKYKAHIVVLAYHGQGHINPIVQFSKRLAAKGIKITVTTTLSNTTKVAKSTSPSITFESIYDDLTEGGVAGPGGFGGFLDRFEASGSRELMRLIRHFQDSENPATCLIYDANIPWATSVANEIGIMRAAFFTQSCAFVASFYPKHCDLNGVVPSVPFLSMPAGLPEPRLPNLPSLGSETGHYPPIIRYILRQFDNSEKADWVLFNSFQTLEDEVVNWMLKLWPMRTIGPTLPSVYQDNRVEDDTDYILNIHTPKTDTCIRWLDSQESGSVVYISFGSTACLTTEQATEMRKALQECGERFLWVIEPSNESGTSTNFISPDQGLMVEWAPQLSVLSHDAVGCFVSHCGWNSTLEAISLGVPIVAMPQVLDQVTNAHYVEHVWEVGIIANADERGYSTSDEIKRCIQEIMHGTRGEGVIKKNVAKWKALAKEAVDEGGTSDKCVDEIIAKLVVSGK